MWEREIFDTDLYHLVGAFIIYSMLGWLVESIFEFIVGKLMIKFLGSLWWDYNDKPFNYKGIICLESTIAWGFYALGIVYFLQNAVYDLVDRIHKDQGIVIISVVFFLVFVDYAIQFMKVFDIDLEEKKEKIEERVKSFKSRWS